MTRRSPGTSCSRRSAPYLAPTCRANAISDVGFHDGRAADLDVAVRIGEVENQHRAGRLGRKVLQLLPRRVEREGDLIVLREEPDLGEVRIAVLAHGRQSGELGVEKISVTVRDAFVDHE